MQRPALEALLTSRSPPGQKEAAQATGESAQPQLTRCESRLSGIAMAYTYHGLRSTLARLTPPGTRALPAGQCADVATHGRAARRGARQIALGACCRCPVFGPQRALTLVATSTGGVSTPSPFSARKSLVHPPRAGFLEEDRSRQAARREQEALKQTSLHRTRAGSGSPGGRLCRTLAAYRAQGMPGLDACLWSQAPGEGAR